jgi:hypothetical protein
VISNRTRLFSSFPLLGRSLFFSAGEENEKQLATTITLGNPSFGVTQILADELQHSLALMLDTRFVAPWQSIIIAESTPLVLPDREIESQEDSWYNLTSLVLSRKFRTTGVELSANGFAYLPMSTGQPTYHQIGVSLLQRLQESGEVHEIGIRWEKDWVDLPWAAKVNDSRFLVLVRAYRSEFTIGIGKVSTESETHLILGWSTNFSTKARGVL